jgi:hypothetical protein
MKEKDRNIENPFEDRPKVTPFRVPENYFETFADRLHVRIKEEELNNRKKSFQFYLKSVFTVAASFAVVALLMNVPYKRYFSSEKEPFVQQQSIIDSADSKDALSSALISYLSEDQIFSELNGINDIESNTVSPENLADFIAANYNDYEIIANN